MRIRPMRWSRHRFCDRMLTLEGAKPPRNRGAVQRTVGFARPYFLGLGYSIALFAFGWITRRGRAAIVELCGRLGYRYDRREPATLAEVSIDSLVGDCSEVTLCSLDSVDGNVTDRELIVLCGLVRAFKPKSIFELGTFDGRTTRNLTANTSDDARVWTIDLPRESIRNLAVPIHSHEQKYAEKTRSGEKYRGTPEEARIIQLYGDSGTYDFSKLYDTFDFVFVDASHAYQYVVNDSLIALKLLRRGGGTIAWHDYGRWDGVTRALNDLQLRHSVFHDAVAVQGTTLAVLRIQPSE